MLSCTPLRDVFEGEQNGRVIVAFIEDLARIQEHDALADVGERVPDFIAVQLAMLRGDLLQQRTQCRNVPLAVAQCVEHTALRVLPPHPECQVEGATCSDDAQVLVKNKKGLSHGVDDGLRQRMAVPESSKWISTPHPAP